MVLTIAAQKGGVGKTTTAISLASYFARNGKTTLLIDIDGQGNASQVLLPHFDSLDEDKTIASILLEDKEFFHHPSFIPNLRVVPSHVRLSEAEQILGRLPAKERRLQMQLNKIIHFFDIVIIDCPPNVNDLPYNALVASDYVIVPFEADGFNLKGIKLMFGKIDEVKKYFNPNLVLLGLLATKYDQTTKISKEVYELLCSEFGKFKDKGLVFDTKIPKNVAITYAQTKGKDIFTFEEFSPSALAYKKFIETELIPYFLSK